MFHKESIHPFPQSERYIIVLLIWDIECKLIVLPEPSLVTHVYSLQFEDYLY